MTLSEKIGQMTQVEKNSITPEEAQAYHIGSILSGGGGNPEPNTAQNWREMVNAYIAASLHTPLAIPIIYGVDAVHGHNNVSSAVIFPHNIGLGASRSTDLVQRIAQATARTILATNIHWNFSPAVSVPQDVRWGRTYEGYSEDTNIVIDMSTAYLNGFQNPELGDTKTLACAKHFVGDGGTTWGSTKTPPWASDTNDQLPVDTIFRIDQGDTEIDFDTLRNVHLAPYITAIAGGVRSVMISHSSWQGLKMHAHKHLITDVLKGEMNFTGFVVSDWMSINLIDADYYVCVVTAVNAGLDMNMVPYEYKRFIETLTRAVEQGDVAIERIDDAVRRILTVKFELGLFEAPYTNEAWLDFIGSDAHYALAREAVQKTATLLKHDNTTLPIRPEQSVLVSGQAADDIGLACGGWTISWQGSAGATTVGSTLLEGIRQHSDNVTYTLGGHSDTKADIGVVVIAEEPYAEGFGDAEDLNITDAQKQLIQATRANCDKLVLVVYSGRPIIIADVVETCDVVIAAWLPGSEASALADNLYGDVAFTAKLSYTWIESMEQLPRKNNTSATWQVGHGLTL
jgi:beta-glucosidase